NPNQRTPCVLVLDASASMSDETSTGETRMDGLNKGVAELESAIKKDDVALGRVQLAIVSVGGMSWDADIMMDWTDAVNFSSFPIQTGGATPLAKGLKLALQLVEDGKNDLNAAGISYTRPWIIVISDGEPTDIELWDEAVSDCIEAEADKKVEIFAIGVEDADMDTLGQITSKPSLKLNGLKFKELFVWLSSSLSAASRSRPGENVQLPSTDPWRDVGI
ncbi:VWA domain-containing protein, partial [Methylophilaceae bacterium]|nr:VWA domain-containing protein [Methylophilaceae bacterium]